MAKQSVGTVYFDHDGFEITRSEYEKLDKSKTVYFKRFENDTISVVVRCVGILSGIDGVPREHWKRWAVEFTDITREDYEGNILVVPKRTVSVDMTTTFRTLQQAEKHFAAAIIQFSDSYMRDDGTIKEVNNIYAPPDPDVPQVTEATTTMFGSW